MTGSTREQALEHLLAEARGALEQAEAERDRYKAKVADLTQKLAASAMAVHSDAELA